MPKGQNITREEKRKKEYLEDSNSFQEIKKKEFKTYSKLLKELNSTIDKQHDKMLGSNSIQSLKQSYETAIGFTSELLRKKDKAVADYHYIAMQKTLKAMSKDYKALISYEKKINSGKLTNPLSFGEILEQSRSKTIKAEGDVNSAGAGQNTRYVVNTGDKKVFFTKSQKGQSLEDDLSDLKKKMIDKYGIFAEFLKNGSLTNIVSALRKEDNFDMNHLSNSVYNYDENESYFRDVITRNTPNAMSLYLFNTGIESNLQFKIFQEYTAERFKICTAHGINAEQGINDKCKQDKRNSASSMVAELLGRDDLLAHSENVNLKIPGASGTIKGTAMDEAKGEDLNTLDSNSAYLNILEEDLDKSSSLKRDIADLQVHDFIVGNPDRHMKNITYRFDENGKICGLMGIDNDTCFGENYIATNSSLRSVSPDQMGIITANTAKKILALDENTLRNSLYGFDLTVKEVDGAIERLKIMKDVIKTSVKYYDNNKIPDGKLIPGVPRIVEEKDLDKYSFEKGLISFRAEKQGEKTKTFGNTFAAVYSKMMEKQTVINDVRKSNLNRLNEFSDNVLTTGMELYNTAEKMEDINGWYHFGSNQFDTMLEKSAAVSLYALKNKTQLFNPVKYYEEKTPVHRMDFTPSSVTKEYKKKCEEALAATDIYLTERAAKNKDVLRQKKNSAGWKRYQLALANKEKLQKTLKKLERAEKALEDNKTLTDKEPELLASAKKQKAQDIKANKKIAKTV